MFLCKKKSSLILCPGGGVADFGAALGTQEGYNPCADYPH